MSVNAGKATVMPTPVPKSCMQGKFTESCIQRRLTKENPEEAGKSVRSYLNKSQHVYPVHTSSLIAFARDSTAALGATYAEEQKPAIRKEAHTSFSLCL